MRQSNNGQKKYFIFRVIHIKQRKLTYQKTSLIKSKRLFDITFTIAVSH